MNIQEIARVPWWHDSQEATNSLVRIVDEFLAAQPTGSRFTTSALLRGIGATPDIAKPILDRLGKARRQGHDDLTGLWEENPNQKHFGHPTITWVGGPL